MNEKYPFDSEANDPRESEHLHGRPEEPGGAHSEGASAQTSPDLARIQRAAEQAHFLAAQQAVELEQQKEEIRHLRRRGWIAALLFAAILTGLTAYSYPLWKEQATKLAQLPGIQQSLTAIGQRVDAAEEKLNAWAGEQSGLVKQVVSLEKQVRGNLQAARKQAEELATQVRQTLRTELAQLAEQTEARLSWLETSQETDRIRLAKMEEEIGNVRQDLAQEIARMHQETRGNVARLDDRLDHNGRQVESVARRLDRNRVHFEVSKGQTRDLIPGVSVTILGTDVSHQFARGWVRLVPEGRTLWLTGLGIHQAVRFYRQTG
ncbi:MAG: hypothetical protein HY647_01945, partial [Acidobacteria bacterium]|nr:hypothetical protein [Acidobacteriota bacterium]